MSDGATYMYLCDSINYFCALYCVRYLTALCCLDSRADKYILIVIYLAISCWLNYGLIFIKHYFLLSAFHIMADAEYQ